MDARLRAGAIAGALAPFVFLLGTVVISWLENDFMEQLGWEPLAAIAIRLAAGSMGRPRG